MKSAATVILLMLPVALSADEPSLDKLDPANTPARLLCVTNKWAVWRTSTLIEATRKLRAPSYVYRVYRQELSERDALLVYTVRDTSGPDLASVMADGTVVLSSRRLLSWCADGEVKRHPVRLPVLSLYSDGVLLHDPTGTSQNPVHFVPFRGHELATDKQVEVVPAGMKHFSQGEPIRHKDAFAWVANSHLYIFDVETTVRSEFDLKVKLDPLCRVTAFDGETVVAGRHAFDAKEGYGLHNPNHAMSGTFAVRHRIGYHIAGNQLMATYLASFLDSSVTLGPAQPGPAAQTDKGIVTWDGKKWIAYQWLPGIQ